MKILEAYKTKIQEWLPNIATEIVGEECCRVNNAVTTFVQRHYHLDKDTILWCIEKLCLSGKSYSEALEILGIPESKNV